MGGGEHGPPGEGTWEQSGVQRGRIQETSNGCLHMAPGLSLEEKMGLIRNTPEGSCRPATRKLASHTRPEHCVSEQPPEQTVQSPWRGQEPHASGAHRLCPMWLPVLAMALHSRAGHSTDSRGSTLPTRS